MMFFGSTSTPVYENILKFRTLNTMIRTWVEREKDGPDNSVDFLEINTYVASRRQAIDAQPFMTTALELAKEFPRIVAVEVMNGSGTDGVLHYPRWP